MTAATAVPTFGFTTSGPWSNSLDNNFSEDDSGCKSFNNIYLYLFLFLIALIIVQLSDGSEQEADIESIYIHEDFNKGPHLNNDIALIKLKNKGLRLDTWIRPVCLPPLYADYIAGMNCTISGWGSNGRPGAGYSRRLKAAVVPILKETECRASYVYGESALSQGMFCAGSLQGGADSCQGDSGGPFVCSVNGRTVLYGITSWGHGCGRSNKPGVYTRVGLYMDWIRDRISDSLSGR